MIYYIIIIAMLGAFGLGHWLGYCYGRYSVLQERILLLQERLERLDHRL